MARSTRLYPCSQDILYAIALLGWRLCRRYQADFKRLKAVYTDQWVDDAIAAVNAAMEMANRHQRDLMVQRQRDVFVASLKLCLGYMQKLKRYIRSAYKRRDRAAQYAAAGFGLYESARKGNLTDVRQMLDAALQYVAANETILKANNNMPDDFVTAFKGEATNCDTLSYTIADVEVERGKEAKDKNEANNDIYDSLMTMLEDGQEVFRLRPSFRSQFVFSSLLKIERGHHPAKLRGFVYDAVTGKALANVIITVLNTDYKCVSDNKGRYVFERIAGNTYRILVEREGYEPLVEEVTVKPGKAKHVKFRLNAVVLEAVA